MAKKLHSSFDHVGDLRSFETPPNYVKMIRSGNVTPQQMADQLALSDPATARNIVHAMGETEIQLKDNGKARLAMAGVLAGGQKVIAAQRPDLHQVHDPPRLRPSTSGADVHDPRHDDLWDKTWGDLDKGGRSSDLPDISFKPQPAHFTPTGIGTMRFNPSIPLDTTQIEDRRKMPKVPLKTARSGPTTTH